MTAPNPLAEFEICRELDRLALVIASAVREHQSPTHREVLDLLTRNAKLVHRTGENPDRKPPTTKSPTT